MFSACFYGVRVSFAFDDEPSHSSGEPHPHETHPSMESGLSFPNGELAHLALDELLEGTVDWRPGLEALVKVHCG